jgi:hypothetical protein
VDTLKTCVTCKHDVIDGHTPAVCKGCTNWHLWEPNEKLAVVMETPVKPLDDNPKTAFGLKKPAMSSVPPAALIHLMRAMADGRRKYGHMNWREKNVSSTIYYDAAMRHLMAWLDGQNTAEDSGVHHLGHVMACCAIILDAEAHGNLNDDRPFPGPFPAVCKEFTEA